MCLIVLIFPWCISSAGILSHSYPINMNVLHCRAQWILVFIYQNMAEESPLPFQRTQLIVWTSFHWQLGRASERRNTKAGIHEEVGLCRWLMQFHKKRVLLREQSATAFVGSQDWGTLLNTLGQEQVDGYNCQTPFLGRSKSPEPKANGMTVNLKMDIRPKANVMPIKLYRLQKWSP